MGPAPREVLLGAGRLLPRRIERSGPRGEASAHSSSTSRGLTPRPRRAISASTSLWIHGVGASCPPSGSMPSRRASQLVSPLELPARSYLIRPQRIAISLMLRPCRSLAAITASLSLRFRMIGLRCRRCISRRKTAVES